jgi:N-acetylneuraminate synthase
MAIPRSFVMAEVGVNHNGNLDLAKQLVEVAKAAGADAVKFQSFRTDRLVRSDAPKADYQKETTGADGGQMEMLRGLELSPSSHRFLARTCSDLGIEFVSSPFDEESADLLDSLGVRRFKVASGEITNLILLRHIAKKGKPLIISTGMAVLDEIRAAVDAVRAAGVSDITLLHCVSDYPTRPEDVNLRFMESLRDAFRLPVGLSDHTPGIAVSIAAVALGACVIEKHITLGHDLGGPDHRASMEPDEFTALVRGIREAESALGSREKQLTPGEQRTRQVARRSLMAAAAMPAGTILESRHLTSKRPGTGLSPMELDKVLGKRLRVAKERDEMIGWGDLE